MLVKRYSGKYSIEQSDTVLLFNNQSDYTIRFEMSNTFQFTIKFVFDDDPGKKQDLRKQVDTEKNIITFECIHFDNLLGTGTTTPLDIATFNEKKLFLNFHVSQIAPSSPRMLTYTLYSE